MEKNAKPKRCNHDARSGHAREVGCPLDHCPCGTHDTDHKCTRGGDLVDDELDLALARAELLAAGWDPTP